LKPEQHDQPQTQDLPLSQNYSINFFSEWSRPPFPDSSKKAAYLECLLEDKRWPCGNHVYKRNYRTRK
jgi:hypothetical protein